jgi:hypothetical protein
MSDLSPQSEPQRTLIRSLSDAHTYNNEAGTANPLLRSRLIWSKGIGSVFQIFTAQWAPAAP